MAYNDNPVDSTNCWESSDFIAFMAEVEYYTDNAGWDTGDMLEMMVDCYNADLSSDETVNRVGAILREND